MLVRESQACCFCRGWCLVELDWVCLCYVVGWFVREVPVSEWEDGWILEKYVGLTDLPQFASIDTGTMLVYCLIPFQIDSYPSSECIFSTMTAPSIETTIPPMHDDVHPIHNTTVIVSMSEMLLCY